MDIDFGHDRNRSAPKFLTVIIGDDSRFIHLQEPVQHRTVKIKLTQEQRDALSLKFTGAQGPVAHYEFISKCILEES